MVNKEKEKAFWFDYIKYNVCLSLANMGTESDVDWAIDKVVECAEDLMKLKALHERYEWGIEVNEKHREDMEGTIYTLNAFGRNPNLKKASAAKIEVFNQAVKSYHEIITWLNGQPFSDKQEKHGVNYGKAVD